MLAHAFFYTSSLKNSLRLILGAKDAFLLINSVKDLNQLKLWIINERVIRLVSRLYVETMNTDFTSLSLKASSEKLLLSETGLELFLSKLRYKSCVLMST